MFKFPSGKFPKIHIDGRCPRCGASLTGELSFGNKIVIKCKNPLCSYKTFYDTNGLEHSKKENLDDLKKLIDDK